MTLRPDSDEYDEVPRPGPPPPPPPPRRGRGLTLRIALVALAGFGGILWYAYEQGMKAGSDTVAPLIRADTTPVKVRPEQPGGMDVPNQDKLIYQNLQQPGQPPAQVERLLPPPEKPLPPPQPPAQIRLPPATAAAPLPGVPTPPAEAPTPQAPQEQTAAAPPASAPAPAAPPLRSSTPPAGAAPAPAPAPRIAVTPEPARPPATEASRPEPAPPAATAPARPAADPAPQRPVPAQEAARPPAPAPQAGRYKVQIAALRSDEAARAEWARVKAANADILGGLEPTIQRADLGAKGVFYRLQAGPLSEAAASETCTALKQRKLGCLVIRP